MNAIVNGSIDADISIEFACNLLDWKQMYKDTFFKVSTKAYLNMEDHFRNEYKSLFLTPMGVFITC